MLIEGRRSFSATGFFLSNEGLVVTNYHVLSGAASAEIVTYDQKRHKILKVVAASKAADVAVIMTDAKGYEPIPLSSTTTLGPGHSVLSVGNPLGLEWSVTEGIVSNGAREMEGMTWIQHTAPISSGNSGGPLISKATGQVLGMNTFTLAGTAVQNLNFAVPAATITAVLAGQIAQDNLSLPGAQVTTPTQPAPGTGSTPPPTPQPDVKPPITVKGEWPHFLGGPDNRSYASTGPGLQLKELWTLSSTIHSARLVLAHGILLGAETLSSSTIYAFDPATGKVLWERETEGYASAPVAGPHGFYVASGGWVMMFKPDGTRAWRKQTSAGSPILVDGKLIVAGGGKAIAFNPETGDELWSTLLSGDSFGSNVRIAAGNGKVVVPDWSNIHVLDTQNGRVQYSLKKRTDTDPIIDGGLLYVGYDRSLEAYDLATGKLVWSANVGAYVRTTPSIGQGIIVLQADDNYTYGYDARTGKELWSQHRSHGSGGSSTIIGEHVYIGGWNGLEVLALATGKKVTTIMPGEQVSGWVVPTENALFVPDGQWGLYAFQKDTSAPAVPAPSPGTGSTTPAPAPSTPFTAEWPYYRSTPGNSSYAAKGPGLDLMELWKTSSVHSARLVLAHGVLFASSTTSPGYISGFDATTGKRLFEFRMEATTSAPVAGPHGFYVSAGGWVMLFKPDGTRVWRKAAGTSPLLIDDKLIVSSSGKITALDPATGDELWSTVLSGDTYGWSTAMAAAPGRVVVQDRGKIYVLNTVNGRALYNLTHGSDIVPVIEGGRLFVGGSSLYSYDLATGKLNWNASVGTSVRSPIAVGRDVVVLQGGDGYAYGYDARTGKEIWSYQMTQGTGGSASIIGEYVYIGGWNGLEVLELTTGKEVTSIMPGEQVSGWVVATENVLYIADGQWGLYALQKR